jgi:hypothetical protein
VIEMLIIADSDSLKTRVVPVIGMVRVFLTLKRAKEIIGAWMSVLFTATYSQRIDETIL